MVENKVKAQKEHTCNDVVKMCTLSQVYTGPTVDGQNKNQQSIRFHWATKYNVISWSW